MIANLRQNLLGYLFLALGLALIGLAGAPIVVALRGHVAPPPVTMTFLIFVAIGIAVALFGAWLLPSSGVGSAAQGFVAVFGPYLPRVPGLSRIGDPKPPAAAPPTDAGPTHEP